MDGSRTQCKFFFSYARQDWDIHAQKFYEDLAREVALQYGAQVDPVGFIDLHGIEPGEVWPDSLRDALCSAQSFVGLLSPTYFERPYCGKEWALFEKRLKEFQRNWPNGATPPKLMFPVLWIAYRNAKRTPPEFVNDLQLSSYDLGPDYLRWGYRYFAKLNIRKGPRTAFIMKLAADILEATRRWDLPLLPGAQSIREIESAFHSAEAQVGGVEMPAGETGPRVIQIFAIAGRRQEMKSSRQGDTANYGIHATLDWRPYVHETLQKVINNTLAVDWSVQNEVFDSQEKMLGQLKEASENNRTVLFLVDPWTLNRRTYQKAMRAVDEENYSNIAILVLWNLQDRQTAAHYEPLKDLVRQTFCRRIEVQDPNAHLEHITSAEGLQNALIAAVRSIQMKLIEQAPVGKRFDGGLSHPQPMLTGPGGASRS